MGWREQYRTASFRNVQFYVERAESVFGRRAVVHQFPSRDEPTTEDLGRRARQFSVEAYVLGDDFYSQKESLIQAAEREGSGKLVHPYYGTLNVVCLRCSVRDSNTELRMCRIELSFVESGVADTPGVSINAKSRADTAKRNVLDAINLSFVELYSIARQPLAEVNNLLNTVDAAFVLVDTAKRVVSNVASFQRELTALSSAPEALINDSAELVQGMIDVISWGTYPTEGDFTINASNAVLQFDEQKLFFTFDTAAPSDDDTPTTLTANMVQWVAIATAGGMIAETEYATYEDAKVAADIVLDQIDRILGVGITDETHEAFRELRVAIVDDLDARSQRLSRLAQKIMPEGVPAMVLSNELYGSVAQEQDILDRNHIEHPGFVPGKVSLDVVVDA